MGQKVHNHIHNNKQYMIIYFCKQKKHIKILQNLPQITRKIAPSIIDTINILLKASQLVTIYHDTW